MHLGFLDGQGRLYDLNFRTTKRRLRDSDGEWDLETGEAIGGEVSIEAAMFVETDRPHLLMQPTSGSALTTDRRLIFIAGPSAPRSPEEPTTFQVAIHVPRTAVDHLLREAGGREIVELRKEDVQGVLEAKGELTLRAQGPWIGGSTAGFLVVLRPTNAARRAIAPLGL
jgi:hypothetical protein